MINISGKDYRIQSVMQNHRMSTAMIQMPEDGTVNNMISQLVDHVQIHGMQELLPSMI